MPKRFRRNFNELDERGKKNQNQESQKQTEGIMWMFGNLISLRRLRVFHGHQWMQRWKQQCLKLNVVREHGARKGGTKLFWRLCSGRLTAVQGFVNCKETTRSAEHYDSPFDLSSVWFILRACSLSYLQWSNIVVSCNNSKPMCLHTG